MATIYNPPQLKKPLPDLAIPWSETEGITFRALLREITSNTNTDPKTNPLPPATYTGGPSSSPAAQAQPQARAQSRVVAPAPGPVPANPNESNKRSANKRARSAITLSPDDDDDDPPPIVSASASAPAPPAPSLGLGLSYSTRAYEPPPPLPPRPTYPSTFPPPRSPIPEYPPRTYNQHGIPIFDPEHDPDRNHEALPTVKNNDDFVVDSPAAANVAATVPIRPWPLLLSNNKTKLTRSRSKPKTKSQGQGEDLGLGLELGLSSGIPLSHIPLSTFEVVLTAVARTPVEAFHQSLREGIRKQVLEYYAGLEEAERERLRLRKAEKMEEKEKKRALQQRSGGGTRGLTGGRWGASHWAQQVEIDDSSDDDDGDDGAALGVIDAEAYYHRAVVLEGWQIYLEKAQIRWEDNTAASGEHKSVVTLPVNLLSKGRADKELDRYLHMIHLRGYRDLVEISFRWVKEGRTRETNHDHGEKGESCIVIDDEEY